MKYIDLIENKIYIVFWRTQCYYIYYGEGLIILHFAIVQVHFIFYLNFIELFPYHKILTNYVCILLLYFDSSVIGRLDFFFGPILLLSILTPLFLPSSSVSLSYFILAVPMRQCLGKTLVHEFPMSYSYTE